MNGRCENDPLDTAIDVCDKCGGDFCSSCLIYPKGGKKKPMCRTCALALSGVRSRTKPQRHRRRGDIKRAREELRIAAEERASAPPTGFVFFDDDPFFESGSPPEEAPLDPEEIEAPARSGGLLARFGRKPKDDPPPPPPPQETEIRSVQIGGPAPEEETSSVGAGNTPATELLARLKERDGEALTPAGTSLDETEPDPNDIWLPPVAEEEATAPGIASLAAATPPTPGPGHDPTVGNPSPAPAPMETPQPTATNVHPHPADPSPTVPPSPSPTVPAPPSPAVPPSPAPAVPAPPSPAVPVVPAAAAAAQPSVPAPAPVPVDMTPPVFVSEKELRAQGPADTDDGGNWVPPTLRGMAPKEMRDANELPRRRRQSD